MIQKILIGVIGLVLVGAAGYYFLGDSLPSIGEKPLNSATFICDQEKSIKADFYTSKVALTLSDSRTITLPQSISASGARYATESESVVFWNKGDTAFITEGAQGETYSNCEIEVPGQEPRSTYASSTLGISIKYPKSYTLNAGYQYLGFPKKPINGVKVLIPATMATGTNLSMNDTGVSIEQLPRALSCTGDIFIIDNVKATSVTENGVSYSMATTSGAGAGNLYEEMVYAISGSKPCTAVRYFIHSMNIGNFEPGVVREFDRTALLADFDKIRASLVLTATSTTQ
ncbi:MAG: MliC family protein [Minisyncoccota bacterium]